MVTLLLQKRGQVLQCHMSPQFVGGINNQGYIPTIEGGRAKAIFLVLATDAHRQTRTKDEIPISKGSGIYLGRFCRWLFWAGYAGI